MASLARTILEDHLERGELDPGHARSRSASTRRSRRTRPGRWPACSSSTSASTASRSRPAVVYVDHNVLQIDFKNPDDHRFLQAMAARYGALVLAAGQRDLPLRPLRALRGAGQDARRRRQPHDACRARCGMIAIGAGGLDVAVCMAGHVRSSCRPKVVGVFLENELQRPWIQAKDVILELLRRRGVRGGRGAIFEFHGARRRDAQLHRARDDLQHDRRARRDRRGLPGRRRDAHVARRAAARGRLRRARDRRHRRLRRGGAHRPRRARAAGRDAVVARATSCRSTRSSAPSSRRSASARPSTRRTRISRSAAPCSAAAQLSEKLVSATATPGSRQILDQITRSGTYVDLLMAGVRMLEPACGPCVGMGQAPPSGSNSLRTFNRNFPGRSGTAGRPGLPLLAGGRRGLDADRRDLRSARARAVDAPERPAARPEVVQRHILEPVPAEEAHSIQIPRGPNIKPPPEQKPLPGRTGAARPDRRARTTSRPATSRPTARP